MMWLIFFAALFGGLAALGSSQSQARYYERNENEYDNDCGGCDYDCGDDN